jgi:hypothetical protein
VGGEANVGRERGGIEDVDEREVGQLEVRLTEMVGDTGENRAVSNCGLIASFE